MADFLSTLAIAASGLRAQSGRMRVISENLANADSTGQTPTDDPYRRQIPSFTSSFDRALGAEIVRLGRIMPDTSDFEMRLEPGHPAADANGYVRYPNVNPLIEAVDLQEAQRSYDANLNVITATRDMVESTIAILKR